MYINKIFKYRTFLNLLYLISVFIFVFYYLAFLTSYFMYPTIEIMNFAHLWAQQTIFVPNVCLMSSSPKRHFNLVSFFNMLYHISRSQWIVNRKPAKHSKWVCGWVDWHQMIFMKTERYNYYAKCKSAKYKNSHVKSQKLTSWRD